MTIGRRGLPADDADSPVVVNLDPQPAQARRAQASDVDLGHPVRVGARRAAAEPARDDQTTAWWAMVALGLVLALLVGVAVLVFGARPHASPSPSFTPTVSPSPSPSSPTISGPTATSPAASRSQPAKPQMSPTPGGPATPTTSPPPPSPRPSPGARPIDLGDGVVFSVLPGWEVYNDEVVQNERRLIRVRHKATDIRVQAVTLTTVAGSLEEACRQLVADQRQGFTSVVESVVVSVKVTADADGVACSFKGNRTSDGVANHTEFTLLRRAGTTLVFRDTIPLSVPADAPARAQLIAMECAAAKTFKVGIDQCATPARGGG